MRNNSNSCTILQCISTEPEIVATLRLPDTFEKCRRDFCFVLVDTVQVALPRNSQKIVFDYILGW